MKKITSTCSCNNLEFCPFASLLTCRSILQLFQFCQLDILSTCHLINSPFHQLAQLNIFAISSIWPLFLHDILSTHASLKCNFIKSPGKSTAHISAFHNRLSAFRFPPQCYVSVLPAGGEGAESGESLTFGRNTSHWFTLTLLSTFHFVNFIDCFIRNLKRTHLTLRVNCPSLQPFT